MDAEIEEGGNGLVSGKQDGGNKKHSNAMLKEGTVISPANEDSDLALAKDSTETDQSVINNMKSLISKPGETLFEKELKVQAGPMEPLPMSNAFSAVQSPAHSMASHNYGTSI